MSPTVSEKMKTTSEMLGKITSTVEVTHIDRYGSWFFVQGREYFFSFKEYPCFKNARISEINTVSLFCRHHLYWPAPDIDLELDCLQNPDKYPLKYRK